MLAELWSITERTTQLFQPMREKEKKEMTRACCRPEKEEMHRCTVILEICGQTNGKGRSVKEKAFLGWRAMHKRRGRLQEDKRV